MRISDWSSDVCSSDLACRSRRARQVATRPVIKHRIWSRTSAKEQKKPRIRGAFSCNHGTESLHCNHPHHLQALVRIAPLVVVPAHQLDAGRVERDAASGVEDLGAGVAAESGGCDLVLGVKE